MQNVEKEKVSVLAGFLPDLVFALIATALFWFTVGQPETMRPMEQDTQNKKHSVGFDPNVVKQAMELEPGRLMAAGQGDLAIRKSMELASTKPYDVLASICAGNVLSQIGDKQEGFKLLKKAVALAPRSRYIRLNLAERLAADKRYDEAINQFDLIVSVYPRWSKPHMSLAEIYQAMDQPKKSADELKMAIESDPNNVNNGTLHKQRALALAHAGLERQGLEEYVEGDADELNLLGLPNDIKLAAQNWGSVDRAETQYRRDLDQNPDDPLTKLRLARIMLYRGRTAESKTLLQEAAKKAPNNLDIHRNLAVVLSKLGDTNMALLEFRKSVSLEKAAKKIKQEMEQQ